MRKRNLAGSLIGALAMILGSAPQAFAQADVSQTVIINEPNGFTGVCAAPCYAVQKDVEIFFDGNPSAPGVCAVGENTYVYELTHLGGTLASPNIPLTEFEAAVDFSLVASAGFIPGAGIAPTSTFVGTLDVVTWAFPGTPSCPACLNEGNTSEKLFICSSAGPGSAPDNVSTTALILDAPGECLLPVAPACSIDIDKTCCVPPPPGTGGDDDGDSDSDTDSDSFSDSDMDTNGDSDGRSDSDASSDSDSDSDKEDICDSRVIQLDLEVVGGDCGDGTNNQGGKAKCNGPNPIVNPVLDEVDISTPDAAISAAPNADVGVGATFSVTSATGKLRKNTKIHLDGPGGLQKLRIHTSCSKSISCGDQFGALKVVGLETELGGVKSCEPPPPSTACAVPGTPVGTPCDSKLNEAVFKFSPSDCQVPLANPQNGEAKCDGDASDTNLPVSIRYTGKKKAKTTVSPSSGIGDGDTFRVTATGMKSLHPNMKLKIEDDDSVEQSIEFHVSCSQPLACGDQFGSLTLVGFTTKNGLEVDCDTAPGEVFFDSCECPLAPPTPHCTSELEELQLVYLKDLFGSDCSVSNPQGGNASCTGDDLTDDGVSITILTDPTKISSTPASGINEKDILSIVKEVGGLKQQLPNDIEFTATDGSANSQTVEIHTSCSEPLNLGDRFGDFVVFGLDRGDGDTDDDSDDSDSDSDSDPVAGTPGEDGLITLGCEIEYQYKITNPNATTLVDISIDDVPHGPVVSGETLLPAEMKTFFTTKTLFETTVNTATVTGDLEGGGMCSAAQDDVTVTVTLPPQGSFDCSDAKPIDELTMEWTGAQTVNVKAWDGAAGGTLLGVLSSVAPGDVVSVSGMGGSPNDQVWEIFALPWGTGPKLGESKFHISCSDSAMNGVEDCGANQGNGKSNDAGLINDWLLEGISGDETLECTPIVVPPSSGGGGGCGIGFELVLLLPGLAWLYRRRRS